MNRANKNKERAKPQKTQTIGRRCSICTHERAKEINSLINKGKSFRVISRQILGDEKHHDSIGRHTRNCLNLEISALIKERKIENAIDHYREISEQLAFAKDLRISARKYLSDPETGELILIPRSDEIEVIYEDENDTNERGTPKRKRDKLQALLVRFEAGGIAVVKTEIKHVDIRQFALDAIKTTDLVLDKIAKKEGLYQKDRENSDELTQLKRQIERRAAQRGVSYEEELDLYLTLFGDEIKPEIREELASNLVQ